MRDRSEGVFKMHSEDDDYNLPIAFQHRLDHRIEGLLEELAMKNWRNQKSQKERVSHDGSKDGLF